MALKLVKTSDGSHGAPALCRNCGSKHFLKAGLAWNCCECGSYVPINFDTTSPEKLKNDFEVLQKLHKEFKKAVDDLERIVT